MKKISLLLVVSIFFSVCLFIPGTVFAHQPRIIYGQSGEIQVQDPELSQAFYDELKGQPRDYIINSDTDFELYLNLLVPEIANRNGRYSAKVFSIEQNKSKKSKQTEQQIAELSTSAFNWTEFYESFGRDYYLKGPELTKQVSAGEYRVEVYSKDNQGKYVLAVGKTESFDIKSILNIYWQIPLLKISFFKTSVFQFFITPFGIAGIALIGFILIFIAFINYLIALIKRKIKERQAKTLLLTSGGMGPMKDEILQLLTKPAYDVTVAFITTAAKPIEDLEFLKRDWQIMKEELRFNIEEIDIEGKTEQQVEKLLELKDIVFVEGGNAFYLMKAMRACNFEKIIKKLLRQGVVYIGVSAGSIVAGKTIKTAGWKDADRNIVGLKDLRGLNLVPFDIFVHYYPEWDNAIKEQITNPKKRAKELRILTDEQAILVQGKEVDLIGDGEAIVL